MGKNACFPCRKSSVVIVGFRWWPATNNHETGSIFKRKLPVFS